MLSLSFLQDDLPNLRTNVYGYILISVNLVHFGKKFCSNNIFRKYTKNTRYSFVNSLFIDIINTVHLHHNSFVILIIG